MRQNARLLLKQGLAIPAALFVSLFKKSLTIKAWVRIAVSAAEQIYNGPGKGAEKKEYVQSFLQSKGYKVDFDTLDTLIESEVSLLWQDRAMLLGESD